MQATGTGIVNIVNDDMPGVAMANQTGVEGGPFVFQPKLKDRYYKPLAFCWWPHGEGRDLRRRHLTRRSVV